MKEYKKVLEETVKDWGKPIASYKITFDSQQNQLEPIYYWILDFMQDARWKVKKITDNFMASPGSGQFSDLNSRATVLQEQGMKMLGAINQVVKSILNLVYDLKEFELRLKTYDAAKSNDKKIKEAGLLGLKQIWLDQVDIKRGRGSIHMMANELGFTTIREAFMMADDLKMLEGMNSDKGGALINDQVYRILVPRLKEFQDWIGYSEKELRKRMSIEKNYLKSQVETLKLYSAWMKPYLRAAEELRQQGFEGNAALVNAFSTSMFELTLLGKKNSDVPDKFKDKMKIKEDPKLEREYYQVVLINLKYRGHVSQRVTQRGDYGFAMGGRVDMTFDCYALNEEEMALVDKKLAEEDVGDMYKFSQDVAEEALEEMKEDLDYFLKSPEEKEKEEVKKKEEKKSNDLNPIFELFNLLFGWIWSKKKDKDKKKKKEINDSKDIRPDNYIERTVRANAAKDAADGLFSIYDIYKKAHGHSSSPEPFENADGRINEPGVKFKQIFKK